MRAHWMPAPAPTSSALLRSYRGLLAAMRMRDLAIIDGVQRWRGACAGDACGDACGHQYDRAPLPRPCRNSAASRTSGAGLKTSAPASAYSSRRVPSVGQIAQHVIGVPPLNHSLTN